VQHNPYSLGRNTGTDRYPDLTAQAAFRDRTSGLSSWYCWY